MSELNVFYFQRPSNTFNFYQKFKVTEIHTYKFEGANTNGLLDNDSMSSKWQNEVKIKLRDYLTEDKILNDEDKLNIDPTCNFSLRSSLNFIGNPVEMCRQVYFHIKEVGN